MAFTVFRRAALQQSTLERAFSGVYRVFRRAAAPKRARHPTEHSGEGAQLRLQFSGGWPSNRAAIQQSTLERAFSGGLLEGGRPEAPPRSARGIQQSTLERAFSGVYSLPEGGRPETCAASNRARWRGRLVAFAVFRRAAAPKRAGNLTEQFGESARGIQQSSLESAMSE